jgi:hypothetical protein
MAVNGKRPDFRCPTPGAAYQPGPRRLPGLYPAGERDEGSDGSVFGGLTLFTLLTPHAYFSPNVHAKIYCL